MSTPTAATPAELLASLVAALPSALPTTMTVTGRRPTAGNDLYEAYLFGLVLTAARRQGFGITLEDADGLAATLRLRRSPGRLPSGGSRGARFTHAVLTCPPRPSLEVHTGVGVVGQSKVVHEADVLVLPQDDALRCRNFDLDPLGRDAELMMEAKYYTNPVGLGTGREFLGLRVDVSAKQKVFVATIASDSVTSLLSGKKVPHDVGVLPRRRGETSLLGLIERTLRDYRSRR
jgi:hypothetical protein